MNCRVLVVDDEKQLREYVAAELKRHGGHVDTAASAEEAISRFSPGKYDVLVAAFNLPDLSGIDLIKAVRGTDERIGIVMISPPASAHDAEERCEGLGVWSVMTKPFTIHDFLEKVETACEMAHMSPEMEQRFSSGFDEEARAMRGLRENLASETSIVSTEEVRRAVEEEDRRNGR